MKVPPKRKGNPPRLSAGGGAAAPSMKVPPKRKGNPPLPPSAPSQIALNESPSEKEGKFELCPRILHVAVLALNESPSEKEGKLNSSGGTR